MNIFITGIRGFIAGHLSQYLKEQGCSVSGSTSQPGKSEGDQRLDGRVFPQRLGDPVEESIFLGMDVVVHCSHDFQKGAFNKNVEGTIALAEAAKRQGVRRQIFISSLSSRPDAQSEYGKSKFAAEGYFKEMGGIIVRPGTVLGEGGIFGKMVHLVKTSPVVPLLDGGYSQMYVIGRDDLCHSLHRIINGPENRGEYNLYYPEKVTLREMLLTIRHLFSSRTFLIPIPAIFLLFPLSLLNRLGIKLPIDIENLRGFIKSQAMIYQSDLPKLLTAPFSLEDVLKRNCIKPS
jgi:nucleoside-diphosphate-sugar epimerase